VQSILWYNTGGLNYSDSLSLGFDACAIRFGYGALDNTYRRGQYDNGSCLATFDAECINAVQRQAEESAMQLVGSPTYLSDGNLTANSIVGICDEISRRMATALPQPCKPYYNETGYSPVGVALTTDYNSTGFFFGSPGDPCMLKPSGDFKDTLNGVFAIQEAEVDVTSHAQYDSNLNHLVNAILTVFMPVANSERQVSVTAASSIATCPRITQYNPGSRIQSPRGEPTPVQISAGHARLTRGGIAGVIVATTLSFGILVVVLVTWWLRRRKAHRTHTSPSFSESPTYEKDSQVAVATTEIGDDGARHELQHQVELPDVGSKDPYELEASHAGIRHTERLPL
jgi:hypothetical protein